MENYNELLEGNNRYSKMADEIDKILNDKKRFTAVARASFNQVDTDKSGFIDESELKTVIS
jgi:hypothetical protein